MAHQQGPAGLGAEAAEVAQAGEHIPALRQGWQGLQHQAIPFGHDGQAPLGHQADGTASTDGQFAWLTAGGPEFHRGLTLLKGGALHQQITGVVGAEAGKDHGFPFKLLGHAGLQLR